MARKRRHHKNHRQPKHIPYGISQISKLDTEWCKFDACKLPNIDTKARRRTDKVKLRNDID